MLFYLLVDVDHFRPLILVIFSREVKEIPSTEFQQNDAGRCRHADENIVFRKLISIINMGCLPTLGHILTSRAEDVQGK